MHKHPKKRRRRETPLDRAIETADRIRQTLAETVFSYEEHSVRLTSSFGVCFATSPVETAEQLLLRADELLYRSKREGRNRVSS